MAGATRRRALLARAAASDAEIAAGRAVMQENNEPLGSGSIGVQDYRTFSHGVTIPGRSVCVRSRR